MTEIFTVTRVRPEKTYVLRYTRDTRADALRMLGRLASNPDLSFSWYDAAVLSQKIRRENALEVANNRLARIC
jgi:hypothetical protein